MNETNEFSFRLKPSTHGVGVFANHKILKGSYLRLFGERNKEGTLETRTRTLSSKEVPPALRDLCISRGDKLICPPDFGEMTVGWYLNHSSKPNAIRDQSYRWHALRDIAQDEEITIDYNVLDEPEEAKEDFYTA